MEEIEVPTEHLHEEMHHRAEGHGEDGGSFASAVALSSAITAVLAAIAALLAGANANEAMIDQIRASDKWAYYQAKGIKAGLLSSKMELLAEMGKTPRPKDEEKIVEYKKQQEETQKEAQELENESHGRFHRHEVFARGVTLFQVAIALAAISVLSRRRRFFFVSLGFVLVGVGFLVQGFLQVS
jgi:hypothetical protein